jgi:ABC-type Fe3+-siderophore transport system permease subunit
MKEASAMLAIAVSTVPAYLVWWCLGAAGVGALLTITICLSLAQVTRRHRPGRHAQPTPADAEKIDQPDRQRELVAR